MHVHPGIQEVLNKCEQSRVTDRQRALFLPLLYCESGGEPSLFVEEGAARVRKEGRDTWEWGAGLFFSLPL